MCGEAVLEAEGLPDVGLIDSVVLGHVGWQANPRAARFALHACQFTLEVCAQGRLTRFAGAASAAR